MPQAIIYLDEELDKGITYISKETGKSKHDVIIRILKEYFERREK